MNSMATFPSSRVLLFQKQKNPVIRMPTAFSYFYFSRFLKIRASRFQNNHTVLIVLKIKHGERGRRTPSVGTAPKQNPFRAHRAFAFSRYQRRPNREVCCFSGRNKEAGGSHERAESMPILHVRTDRSMQNDPTLTLPPAKQATLSAGRRHACDMASYSAASSSARRAIALPMRCTTSTTSALPMQNARRPSVMPVAVHPFGKVCS